jgi:hypothetical protein
MGPLVAVIALIVIVGALVLYVVAAGVPGQAPYAPSSAAPASAAPGQSAPIATSAPRYP